MITRHKKYEFINGKWAKVQSEKVAFVCITGEKSAKVIDKNGKQHTVRRDTLLDVPNHILWPNITIVGTMKADTESWKKATYFD